MGNQLLFSKTIFQIIAETENYEIQINYCRIGSLFTEHFFKWDVESPYLDHGYQFDSLNEAVEKAFNILYKNEDNLKLDCTIEM